MNYRHIYHAGNFADVFKHALLALVVDYLTRKDKPFFVLDTHAGLGAYDLSADEAQRTGEWRDGIGRILAEPDPPEALRPYLGAVRALDPDGGMARYPGSPRIARHFMRPGDRLMASELHPEDAAVLKSVFARDRQTKVLELDGYTALKANVPPKERRGLVLMDPPFEQPDEFSAMVRALTAAYRKWPTGIYGLWYPVKGGGVVPAFHGELATAGLGDVLVAEMTVMPVDETTNRLNGTGMVLINPPWTLEDTLHDLLPWLTRVLGRADLGGGGWRLAWLSRK
ncbi:Protein involved in catabolism of external DNA [Caenispirillum salinarum AK4]|uniref:Ribosomal RNA large subunit methyltransferase J n=1 Tax=Caenispirillum salinarum AK4 TaxID=1238182 RepID=K9HFI3_9PROT|nr:23S rRNA (adenine(2030)-N(6))-methyltransferase RlmJ [Caenispirillum salinarum]EKV29173.1 Protein involved in catabolism of external DNA [Caenispirillum salinarum AK4]